MRGRLRNGFGREQYCCWRSKRSCSFGCNEENWGNWRAPSRVTEAEDNHPKKPQVGKSAQLRSRRDSSPTEERTGAQLQVPRWARNDNAGSAQSRPAAIGYSRRLAWKLVNSPSSAE